MINLDEILKRTDKQDLNAGSILEELYKLDLLRSELLQLNKAISDNRVTLNKLSVSIENKIKNNEKKLAS